MYFKRLVDENSHDTNSPAPDVRKVGLAFLECYSLLIKEQEDSISPVITLPAFTTPAKPAAGHNPVVPASKFACMTIRQQPKVAPSKSLR